MNKKVAIIGHGYVGEAMERYFKDHFDLGIWDPLKFNQKDVDKKVLEGADMAVICVPTPMSEDGKCDTSIVEETLGWLRVPIILIKSTVPPGTTARLQKQFPEQALVFSPEYIGEGKYYVPTHKGYPHPTDMKQHEFFIFGADTRSKTEAVIAFFLKVSGPDARYMQTDSTTAELVKYAENSWGATKVTFFNEFYEIAKAFGVDYNEMRELLLLDKRIERMHTAVFPDKRGFGGKCYPKDVNAIVRAAAAAGYEPKLLRQVLSSNDDFTAKN